MTTTIDYADPSNATHVRIFPDGAGNYQMDAMDDDGNYTEVCWDSWHKVGGSGEREWRYIDSIEKAIELVPAFIGEVVPHLAGTKPKVKL